MSHAVLFFDSSSWIPLSLARFESKEHSLRERSRSCLALNSTCDRKLNGKESLLERIEALELSREILFSRAAGITLVECSIN